MNKILALLIYLQFAFFAGIAQQKINIGGTSDGSVKSLSLQYFPEYIFASEKVEKFDLSMATYNTEATCNVPQLFKMTSDSGNFFLLVDHNQKNPVEPRILPNEVVTKQEVNLYNKDGKTLMTAAGQNAILQSFYNNYRQQFDENYDKILEAAKDKTIDAFEDDLFKTRKEKLKWLEAEKQNNPFSGQFETYIRKEINYTYYSLLLGYTANDCAHKKVAYCKALPAILLEKIATLKIDDDELLYSEWYKHFVLNYTAYYASAELNFVKPSNMDNQVVEEFKIIQSKLSKKTKAFALAELMLNSCSKISLTNSKKLLQACKEAGVSTNVYKLLQLNCKEALNAKPVAENTKEKTVVSEANHEVSLLSMAGEKVDLNSFGGKVVYIDFWASWCGPCRQQFPFSKKLHESLTEKQLKKIVFLYISIDDNKEAWKKAIEQNDLQGTQLLSPGGWQSEACSYFKIASIPRYMIMDKNGKIVNENAKRPSDETLKQELLDLIKD